MAGDPRYLPLLLERPEAHIANVASMGGFFPFPGQSVYGASKAAVIGLTKAVAADFIRQGIEDGSVRDVNPTLAQEMIAGAVNASMDITLWRRVDDMDAAAIDYFDIFFNGLLPRG